MRMITIYRKTEDDPSYRQTMRMTAIYRLTLKTTTSKWRL
jgi:hypothetical protein